MHYKLVGEINVVCIVSLLRGVLHHVMVLDNTMYYIYNL